jgi:hypothetical protein
MTSRQYKWTPKRLVVVASHLATQHRFDNAFTGQSPDGAYQRDLSFYNTNDEFQSNEVERRHLSGKDGLYAKIYGHAIVLRSTYLEAGRDCAFEHFSLKILGVANSSISVGSDSQAIRENLYDYLIKIADEQMDLPSNPSMMTRTELTIENSLGKVHLSDDDIYVITSQIL